jgi:hypothetical protein
MPQNAPEAFQADVAPTNVSVAIHTRTQWRFGIVGVDQVNVG